MRTLLTRSLLPAALFLGVCSVAAAREESPERAAQRDILALADNLDDPDVTFMAHNIVMAHDSCSISSVFASGDHFGPGIGSLTRAGHRNRVGHLLDDYARKAPPREELEKHQADLDRTARMVMSMSELAPYRNPRADKSGSKQSQEWQRVSAEFKANAREFRAAVNAKEPERVQKASGKLHNTCSDCHRLL